MPCSCLEPLAVTFEEVFDGWKRFSVFSHLKEKEKEKEKIIIFTAVSSRDSLTSSSNEKSSNCLTFLLNCQS